MKKFENVEVHLQTLKKALMNLSSVVLLINFIFSLKSGKCYYNGLYS